MDYQEYYKARDIIKTILTDDLLGPVEEDETISDPPVTFYTIGKLYPCHIGEDSDAESVVNEAEDAVNAEEESTDLISSSGSMNPSSLGFTFAVTKETKEFLIHASGAYYISDEQLKTWHRTPLELEKKISLDGENFSLRDEVADNIILTIREQKMLPGRTTGIRIFTVALSNMNRVPSGKYTVLSPKTFFQPELSVEITNGEFCPLDFQQNEIEDADEQEMNLLYHDVNNFSSGHGCATNEIFDDDEKVKRIETNTLPFYILKQMMPTQGSFDPEFLSMDFLSSASLEELSIGIHHFAEKYERWIAVNEKELACLTSGQEIARQNLRDCRESKNRILSSLHTFSAPTALKAFQLANKAMLYQRMATTGGKIPREKICWYPFQLAFILQEIPTLFEVGELHDAVDLLWFPTGGGKTEAYLGIAAFTMFYRRLSTIENGTEDEGVSVIMRYTLRLLSYQQFERASALICSMEKIRKEERISGHPFRIGLWAGKSLTPNTLEEVKQFLDGRKTSSGSPIQVTKCPWCGSTIDRDDYHIDSSNKRLIINCPNNNCDFHEGLPVQLIDEDIYANEPSFLIGTVDKFMQVAYKEQAGKLLGVGADHRPDLIIQDELHLITGPLGTSAGLFETALAGIVEKDGKYPKLIASTATIKNAGDQIRALYGRIFRQFPPQGLSMKDSFFAREASEEDKATRMYLGIMPEGVSRATAFSRVMGALLFATRYLRFLEFSDEVIDSFWTITGYFNSLRILGNANIRVVDNVQEHYLFLKHTKFKDRYPMQESDDQRYANLAELTSRKAGVELSNLLQRGLLVPYTSDSTTVPYDFLLATNMISVGIDIGRLNVMTVVGQPLKSAEYIQATSRVGRSSPGLVVNLYSSANARDRSHFEQFVQFHSVFNKYIEPSSVTPFADRARDRALQAVYITLVRYRIPGMASNEAAGKFRKDMPGLEAIKNYICRHVEIVDPGEVENVAEELSEIEDEWEAKAVSNPKLIYNDYTRNQDCLYDLEYAENSRLRMINSLRNVEPEVDVITEE